MGTTAMTLVWLMKGVVTLQGMEVAPVVRAYATQQQCLQKLEQLQPLVSFKLRCESERVRTEDMP